jgi:hypothetical protein
MTRLKWLLAALALIACILWMFPKLITGDYAEITIGKITEEPNGQVSLQFSSISSNETPVIEAFYDGDKYAGGGSGCSGGLFGRPGTGFAGVMFMLNPETMHRQVELPQSLWSKRLLVHENETIRLRGGERLYFYNFQTEDGVRHNGYIEVVATRKFAQN